jgi:hypothetical protein
MKLCLDTIGYGGCLTRDHDHSMKNRLSLPQRINFSVEHDNSLCARLNMKAHGYLTCIVGLAIVMIFSSASVLAQSATEQWNHSQFRHVSTVHGDLEPPNMGNQQTASLVADFDNSGINSFIIAERTEAPAVVWYRRSGDGWDQYIIEDEALRIEAGAASHDVTGNGYPDLVLSGDDSSNQLWWWENPGPPYDPETPWVRHTIKNSGANKHHDVIFGDFTGDGNTELAFWNQGGGRLYLAEIPADPKAHAATVIGGASDNAVPGVRSERSGSP